MDYDLVRCSKFISLVLRHRPGLIHLVMDEAGWVDVDALLAGMNAKGMPADLPLLERIVAENDKRRFVFNSDHTRIRAAQGHSVPVDLGLPPSAPPDLLYHGAARQNLASILGQGLKKGKRHAVHLSPDLETARKVGSRRGPPVVLLVQTGRMAADGFTFTRSENGVWLVERVPPEYIRVQNPEESS